MNKFIFGLFLITYGILKMTISSLVVILPEKQRIALTELPVLGSFFENNDSTIASKVFNLCFFIYGMDSFIHGLYLNRWVITTQPFIITHAGAYIFHFILGVFMFSFFYSLINVNNSSYIIYGVYVGLFMLIMVPGMYLYNTHHDTKLTVSPASIASLLTFGIILFIGTKIYIQNPSRLVSVANIIAIPMNSIM